MLAAAAALGPASDGGPTVVVTEDDQVPRLARGRYDEVRFLLVRPRDMERYLERLADADIEELLVVSVDPAPHARGARAVRAGGPRGAPRRCSGPTTAALITVRLAEP